MTDKIIYPTIKVAMAREIDCSEYFNCRNVSCLQCAVYSEANNTEYKEQEHEKPNAKQVIEIQRLNKCCDELVAENNMLRGA